MSIPSQSKPLLSARGLGKSFAGNPVLENVSFVLNEGEVLVLAGENGAGKSTLIKILAGMHSEYSGVVELSGNRTQFTSPHSAALAGISVIHQEMSLIESMNVIDNIFLGREIPRCGGLFIDRLEQEKKGLEICRSLGLEIDLQKKVEELSVSEKNRIEIAKALVFSSRILIMDEPTSSLNQEETEKLFVLIEKLKSQGCGIIYISHKMEEIYRIADRIMVLRDGKEVGTAAAKDLPEKKLISWMIGREFKEQFPSRTPKLGAEVLKVSGFSTALLKDINLSIRAGEIVGIAGLQGSGNSVLFHALFGNAGPLEEGTVVLDKTPFHVSSPRASIRQGLALLTNDRKKSGLVLDESIRENVILASLRAHSTLGFLKPDSEKSVAQKRVSQLSIRSRSIEQEVGTLSGGNQQKVVLAKWLETRPKVLLLDEPTRGVDVGAKHEIYELMGALAERGLAILLITSEMPELLGLSDRVLVMHRGQITAEFSRETATAARITAAAMGAKSGMGAA